MASSSIVVYPILCSVWYPKQHSWVDSKIATVFLQQSMRTLAVHSWKRVRDQTSSQPYFVISKLASFCGVPFVLAIHKRCSIKKGSSKPPWALQLYQPSLASRSGAAVSFARSSPAFFCTDCCGTRVGSTCKLVLRSCVDQGREGSRMP